MPNNAIDVPSLAAVRLNPDRSVDVAATFDAQYPLLELTSDNQRKRAKCTNANFLRLTFNVATVSDLLIFNTNATTIDVTIIGDQTYTYNSYSTLKVQAAQANSAQNNYIQNEHLFQIGQVITGATISVTIDLFHSTDNIEIGYITAGVPYQVGRALIGSNDATKDFSIESEAQNGGIAIEVGAVRRDLEFLVFAKNQHAQHLSEIVAAYRGNRVCVWTTDSDDERFNMARLGYLRISGRSQDNIGITYNLLLKEG